MSTRLIFALFSICNVFRAAAAPLVPGLYAIQPYRVLGTTSEDFNAYLSYYSNGSAVFFKQGTGSLWEVSCHPADHTAFSIRAANVEAGNPSFLAASSPINCSGMSAILENTPKNGKWKINEVSYSHSGNLQNVVLPGKNCPTPLELFAIFENNDYSKAKAMIKPSENAYDGWDEVPISFTFGRNPLFANMTLLSPEKPGYKYDGGFGQPAAVRGNTIVVCNGVTKRAYVFTRNGCQIKLEATLRLHQYLADLGIGDEPIAVSETWFNGKTSIYSTENLSARPIILSLVPGALAVSENQVAIANGNCYNKFRHIIPSCGDVYIWNLMKDGKWSKPVVVKNPERQEYKSCGRQIALATDTLAFSCVQTKEPYSKIILIFRHSSNEWKLSGKINPGGDFTVMKLNKNVGNMLATIVNETMLVVYKAKGKSSSNNDIDTAWSLLGQYDTDSYVHGTMSFAGQTLIEGGYDSGKEFSSRYFARYLVDKNIRFMNTVYPTLKPVGNETLVGLLGRSGDIYVDKNNKATAVVGGNGKVYIYDFDV